MIKFCINKWSKNKDKLKKDICENIDKYDGYDYIDLVKMVVKFIFNDEESDVEYDLDRISEIDNGDYQGTILYLIPEKTYQPSEYEYLMTYVGYGSCSGCDTLQYIQYDLIDKEQKIKDYMNLCLNLVQNTIKPYNYGWRDSDMFEHIEE